MVRNWCIMSILWVFLSWYKPKQISIKNFKFAFNFEFEMIWVFLPLLLSFTWIWKSLELLYFSDNTADLLPLSTVWSVNVFLIESSILEYGLIDKVLSSYGPPAYFSNIFISGKNIVLAVQKRQHLCQKWKHQKNLQSDHNLNGL